MRNQQQENGNRYQFHLHPPAAASLTTAPTTIDEEQQPQHNNNNNNSNKNINSSDNINNNKCVKSTQMSASMKALTATATAAAASKDNNGNNTINSSTAVMLQQQRKQFTPTSDVSNASFSSASVAGSIQDDINDQCSLTQAGLEEYNIRSSSYYDQPVLYHHQKQSSYAQSEGYHSYVSSSDSSSATPFLDRLRQESELLSRQSHHWSQNDLSSVSSNSIAPSPTPLLLALNGRDSGSGSSGSIDHLQHNSNNNNNNNSSESTSSTETLKWLGSMSDVSEASHATGYSAVAESVSSSQLIVHSSRVRTPKRHHSESVLYLNNELHPPPQQQQHQTTVSLQHPAHALHTHQKQQLHTSHYTAAPQQVSPTLSTRDHSPPATATLLSSSSMRINPNHRHSPSYPPSHTSHSQTMHLSAFTAKKEITDISNLPNSSSASVTTVSTPPTSIVADSQQHKSSISVTISNSEAVVTISPQPPAVVTNKTPVGSEAAAHASSTVVINSASPTEAAMTPLTVITSSSSASSTSNIAIPPVSSGVCSTSPTLSTATLSPSAEAATSYRSNHRLFPVSTYTEPVHNNTSQYVQHPKPQYSSGLQKPSQAQQPPQQSSSSPNGQQMKFATVQQQQQQQQSAQASWQSVAELINDFERSNEPSQLHPQKYSYIDPSKTHRVPNPALKAFQKNAVQSYFERQQQQQNSKEQHSIYQQHPSQQLLLQHQQLMRHSFQPTASAKEIAKQQILRNSLPNTFAAGTAAAPTTTATYQQHLHYVSKPMCVMPGQHLSAQTLQMPSLSEDNISIGSAILDQTSAASPNKPPSPAPPPPPPRTRSLMPTLLRRSSSASDYAEFRDQYMRASQEKLQAQSVKNISSSEKSSFNDSGMPPPPPPPRGRASLPTRRTSSASEYAALRDKVLQQQAVALAQHRQRAPHQYYAPAPPTAPPLIMPQAATENWAPERPPKNPNLRVPSPELPPPPAELLDANLSDEPLPPPPPEILHRQPNYEPYPSQQTTSLMLSSELAPSPNRRNSFAGSSARKPASASSATSYNRSTSASAGGEKQTPPAIPKKPSTIDLLQASRPASSMAQQCNKAYKVILNGGLGISSQQPPLPAATARMNANRKRPHNPAAMTNIPPIMENPSVIGESSYNSNSNKSIVTTPLKGGGTTKSSPPPPLKPRMPITAMNQQGTTPVIAYSSNLRCNSKASYLPRQSLEKLNNSDPDHGSYKLTLTSNEDLVGHTKPVGAYDILAHNGKLPNNLPDVLPLGAKLQPQPASPTSANGSPLRYSSNSNISTTTTNSSSSPTHQHSTTAISSGTGYPSMYSTQHRYSTPAMNYYNHNNNQAPSYTRSQSYDLDSNTSPTKFMSQSTIDLKKTHNLETTLEEASTTETSKLLLSPAQSENNLSSSINSNKHSVSTTKPQSPFAARREFHRTTDMGGRTMSLDERNVSEEGRIVRAELVNTTLPNSPNTGAHRTITRKDSLRENIEKITQLQSKLMSAHLSAENTGLMGNFSNKTSTSTPIPSLATKLETETTAQTTTNQSDNDTEADKPKLDIFEFPTDPNTPPMLPKTPPPQLDSPTLEADVSESDPASHILQMDSTTDGLKLMQRSELILRVNPLTVETASQTDDLPDSDMGRLTAENPQQCNKEDSQTRTTLQPRQRYPIELDCDNMSKELAELLAPNDKLIELLTPHIIKSPSDYVSNLYNPNVPVRPTKRDVGTSTLMRLKTRDSQVEQATEKSGIITVELQYADIEVSLTNGSGPDSCDMLKKKVDELIKHLNRKLKILNKEQTTISEESAINDELGNSLVTKLSAKVRPIEATKFRTYIDDVGHITSLLLSLSERLAKSENTLSTIEENDTEKKLLESKRDRLMEQLEEAKRLKEDIERRGTSVSSMLERNLTADEFADFDFFINMKAKLIADARDIADKIKCSEEQLCALSEALIQSDC